MTTTRSPKPDCWSPAQGVPEASILNGWYRQVTHGVATPYILRSMVAYCEHVLNMTGFMPAKLRRAYGCAHAVLKRTKVVVHGV